MKTHAFVCVLALIASAAYADTTEFTLGAPNYDYVPVLTQDGNAVTLWTGYVFDCAIKTCAGEPQAHITLKLPSGLDTYCTGTLVLDTRPAWASKTQQAPGEVVSNEVCGTWHGTLIYNYDSVLQQHCSSGHPGCSTAYYPVLVGGAGTLTTP